MIIDISRRQTGKTTRLVAMMLCSLEQQYNVVLISKMFEEKFFLGKRKNYKRYRSIKSAVNGLRGLSREYLKNTRIFIDGVNLYQDLLIDDFMNIDRDLILNGYFTSDYEIERPLLQNEMELVVLNHGKWTEYKEHQI